ncbi:hypothetical protein J6590_056508 [Homalodisca vitripennis]|nr:hypothetical protein J6590_056508 [Homalodisca vitripennis]
MNSRVCYRLGKFSHLTAGVGFAAVSTWRDYHRSNRLKAPGTARSSSRYPPPRVHNPPPPNSATHPYHRLAAKQVILTPSTPHLEQLFNEIVADNRVKQRRAWLLLGWVTAERSCHSKQPARPAIGGGSEVTFKPLVLSYIRESFLALTSPLKIRHYTGTFYRTTKEAHRILFLLGTFLHQNQILTRVSEAMS